MPGMRSTKIVATVGPASRRPDVLEAMIREGVDVVRLNFAHGSPAEHAETVRMVRAAAERVGRQVAVLQDVPGPKLRLGPVAGGVVELGAGEEVVLTTERIEGDKERLPVAWPGIAELMKEGDVAYLADGAIRLRVTGVADGEVRTLVEVGGSVASRQGMNLPNVTLALPAVSDDDLALIDAGIEMGVDLIALSFVRRPEDLEPVRERLRQHGRDLPLIAKFEKPQATRSAEAIIKAADGIMVARGDLGIELPIEDVPLVQKRLLALAGRYAKPAITATQMLESMVHSTRPTRAEVTDVANAIFDGTDAVMLSQETAVGRHPVEAVRMMAAIARRTEMELPYDRWLTNRGVKGGDQSATIAYGAVGAVYQLGLKALVVPTRTGRTAALISSHRPNVPVLALSPRPEVARRCSFLWGVLADVLEEPADATELIDACAEAAVRRGLARSGDRIGITAGLPPGRAGGTNLFKVHEIP
jgi:pyruvate kinase